MSLDIAIIFILLVLFVAAIPKWPHSRNWGYWPGVLIGVALGIALIVLILIT